MMHNAQFIILNASFMIFLFGGEIVILLVENQKQT